MVQFRSFILVAVLGNSAAFVPHTRVVSPSLLVPQQPVSLGSQEPKHVVQQQRTGKVSLNMALGGLSADQLITSGIFLAAVGATVLQDAKSSSSTTEEKKETPKEPEASKPEPAPEPKPAPEPAPKPAPKPEPEPAPEPASKAESEPEPEPTPAPVVEAGKSISELKKEVASTLSEEKEKMDRLKVANAKKEEEKVAESEPEAEEEVEEAEEEKPKRIKRVKRVLKKIIMPWKKWSDIS